MILTAQALYVHIMAGELSAEEIILIEVVWIPLLLLTRDTDRMRRRALLLIFAAYSAYFLPRLLSYLPWDVLRFLFTPDIIFNNMMFRLMHTDWKMIVYSQHQYYGILIRGTSKNMPFIPYFIGCSTLRSAPLLAVLPLITPGPLKRRLLATMIGIILSYPLNSIRILSILEFAKVFHVNLVMSHILLSPTITVIALYLVMLIQDRMLNGNMLTLMEEGMVELLNYLLKPFNKELPPSFEDAERVPHP